MVFTGTCIWHWNISCKNNYGWRVETSKKSECGYEIFGEIIKRKWISTKPVGKNESLCRKLIPAKFRHQSKTQSKFKVQIEFY